MRPVQKKMGTRHPTKNKWGDKTQHKKKGDQTKTKKMGRRDARQKKWGDRT